MWSLVARCDFSATIRSQFIRSTPWRAVEGCLRHLLSALFLALAWIPASAGLLPSITSDWMVDLAPWLGRFSTAEDACKAREQCSHAIGERLQFTFERVVAGYNYALDPVVMWCKGKHLDTVTGETVTQLGYRVMPFSAICPASSSPVTAFPTSACRCANGYDGDTATGTCIYVPPPEPSEGGRCAADGEYAGNPVAMATAEKFQSEQDFLDGGPAPLSLIRNYRSNWSTGSAHADAGLGLGWTHNHGMVLKANSGSGAPPASHSPTARPPRSATTARAPRAISIR